MITNAELTHGEYAVFFFKSIAYRHQRRSCTRRGMKTEHFVARTFFSVKSCRTCLRIFLITHACGAQVDLRCQELCVVSLRMFHRTLLARPLTGIRSTPCATSPEVSRSGHLAESLPQKGYEPNTCINVGSEHTPINNPSRRNNFNIENGLATTVAASETFDGFHQQVAASGSRTRKPVRGDVSNVSVEGTSRKEKETEILKVRKPCLEGMKTSSRKLN